MLAPPLQAPLQSRRAPRRPPFREASFVVIVYGTVCRCRTLPGWWRGAWWCTLLQRIRMIGRVRGSQPTRPLKIANEAFICDFECLSSSSSSSSHAGSRHRPPHPFKGE
jgi:hypothetical protein